MIDFGPMNDAILGALAETVTIAGVEAEAVFDSRHYAFAEGEAGGSALVTAILVKTAVADTITVGSTAITARSVDYVARDKRPDSAGMVLIELEEA